MPSFFDYLLVAYLFKFCPFIIWEPFFGTCDEMFAKILKSSLYPQKFGKSSASRSIPKVVCCSNSVLFGVSRSPLWLHFSENSYLVSFHYS